MDKTKPIVSEHSSESTYVSAEGPYVSGNIGFAMLSDSYVTSSTLPTREVEFDTGLAIGVALGYGFGNTRIEGEIAYQKNDVDKFGVFGVSFDGYRYKAGHF